MANQVNRNINIYIESGQAQKAADILEKKFQSLEKALAQATDPERISGLKQQLEALAGPLDTARASAIAAKKAVADLGDQEKQLRKELKATDDEGKRTQLRGDLEKVREKLIAAREESRKAADALRDFKRQEAQLKDTIARAADPKQIEKLKRELEELQEPLERARKKLSGELAPSMRDIQSTATALRNEFSRMSEGDEGFEQMRDRVVAVNQELENQKVKMGFLQRATKTFLDEVKTVAVGVFIGNTVEAAFETISGYITGMVTGSAKIADELADIEKTTNLSTEDVNRLSKELGNIDTRTSSGDLRELASEAGKLGKESVEDVKKFVEEADKINVALGEDLGDGAIIKMGKLSKIFKVEMLNIGSAINEIGANSEASESFAVDFLTRLAGTGPAVKLSADQLLGYGAALEVAGQTAEVSGTALSDFFIDFTKNTEKFGQTAGMAAGELTKLVKEKGTNEGFLVFLERLKQANPDAATFLQKMEQLGIDGSRGANVLLALSNNIKGVREQQEIANKAIESNASIMAEFNKKNNNAAAELDKLKKNFAGLFASDTIRDGGAAAVRMLNNLVNVLKTLPKFISENRGALLSLVIGIGLLNAASIKAAFSTGASTLATIRDTVVKRASNIITAFSVAGQLAYAAATQYLAGRITLATAAQRIWSTVTALGAGPIGVLVVAISAAVIAIGSMLGKTTAVTAQMRVQAEVQERVAASTAETKNKIQILTSVINDNSVSLDNRKEALNQLIALNPKYLSGLTLENLKTAEGKKILDEYVVSLEKKAALEAKGSLLNDKLKLREQKQLELKKLEALDNGKDEGLDDFFMNVGSSVGIGNGSLLSQIEKKREELSELRKEIDVLNADVTDAAKKNVTDVVANQATEGVEAAKKTLQSVKDYEDEIARLTKERDTTADAALRQTDTGLIKKYEEIVRRMKGETSKAAKEAKKDAKDWKEVADELRKLAAEAMGESFVQQVEELNIKFDKLREKAKGNAKLVLQVEVAYQDQLRILRAEYNRKIIDEAKKASDEEKAEFQRQQKERVDRLLEAQRKMTELLAQQAATSDANQKAKQELEIEKAFLFQKARLRKDALDRELEQEIEKLRKEHNIKAGEEDKIQYLIEAKREEYRKKGLQADIDNINSLINYAQNVANIMSLFGQAATNRENAELERDRKNNEEKKANLDRRLKAGTLSQKMYDREVQKIEKEQQKREKEVRLKQFKRDQRAAMAQALINGGLAVTETLAKFGPPVPPNFQGIIAMAFTAASIAGQVAAIASRKAPEYARGGRLFGPSHSDPSRGMPVSDPYTGRIHAYMEGGEGITNKHTMSDPNVYTLSGTPSQIVSRLNSLHGGVHWESGAVLRPGWMTAQQPNMNFGAITRALGGARMFAAGGRFGASQDPAPVAAPGAGTPNGSDQLQATLKVLNGTLAQLQQQLQVPLQAILSLSQLQDTEARWQAIQDEATMR